MSSTPLTTQIEDALQDYRLLDGVRVSNNNNPVQLRYTGTSFAQTHPKTVRALIQLEAGASPTIIAHPDLNAVTYIYG